MPQQVSDVDQSVYQRTLITPGAFQEWRQRENAKPGAPLSIYIKPRRNTIVFLHPSDEEGRIIAWARWLPEKKAVALYVMIGNGHVDSPVKEPKPNVTVVNPPKSVVEEKKAEPVEFHIHSDNLEEFVKLCGEVIRRYNNVRTSQK